MLVLLCLLACPSPSAASAPYDVPLDPPTVEVRDTAPDVFAAEPSLLGGTGVIDLTVPPATMPPAAPKPGEPAPGPSNEAQHAIAVEVRSRD